MIRFPNTTLERYTLTTSEETGIYGETLETYVSAGDIIVDFQNENNEETCRKYGVEKHNLYKMYASLDTEINDSDIFKDESENVYVIIGNIQIYNRLNFKKVHLVIQRSGTVPTGGEGIPIPDTPEPSPIYALVDHRHDDLYSPLNHNHDNRYSRLNHNHDTLYSRLNHNHDNQYSSINHNHDNQYSSLNHVHPEYATRAEVSSLAGANHEHHNVLYVSPFRVQGDVTGVLCEIEPSDALVLEDLWGDVFCDLDIRGRYVFMGQSGADPDRVYHLLYYAVVDDDVQQDVSLNVGDVYGNRGESVNLYSIVSDVNNAPVDEGTVEYDLDYGDEQP